MDTPASPDVQRVIERLKRRYTRMQHDGLSLASVTRFVYTCVRNLYLVTAAIPDLDDVERKVFVCETVRDIYNTLDPDIPLLPDMVEIPLEQALLNIGLPRAYDLVAALLDDKDDD